MPRQRWHRPKLSHALGALLFVTVALLLLHHARGVDWVAALAVVRNYTASTLLLATALTAASYALYCCYDLVSRHEVGHRLRTGQVLTTAFVSYAFNLNLGALVGGVALRYRLYSRLGLRVDAITQVLALSVATNWLGYLTLAGTTFAVFPLALPPGWPLGNDGLRLLGVLLLTLACAYLFICFSGWRCPLQLRGRTFRLPSGPVAMVQLSLSCANWLLVAMIVAVLLGGRIEYPTVLAVLLIAAVAGVIAHVPAGLGVLEAVFIVLLSHRLEQAELLGALLGYRAVYCLLPLILALGIYLGLEARTRRRGPR
jgi:uncharacterized membrane protein YbhN (UPF0104 family)